MVDVVQCGAEERWVAAWFAVLVMCDFVRGRDRGRDGVEAVGRN